MATEAAIHTDVAEAADDGLGTEQEEATVTEIVHDEPLPAEPEVKTDRNTMIERIAERRRKELADEIGEAAEVVDDEPPEGEEDETPIEVKIDGETRTVTEKQIAEYQKNVAADRRLEEAVRRQRELDKRETDLAAKEAALNALKAAAPVEDNVSDDEVQVLAAELITSVFSEDQESVAKLIRKMRAVPKQASATVSQEEINVRVDQALAVGETRKAVKRFSEVYSELDKEPVLRSMVDQRTIVEQQNDPDAPPWDIIDRSAKYVSGELRKKFGGGGFPEPEVVIDDLDERRMRKRAAQGSVKTDVSKTAPVNPRPAKPALSPVQEIMKARGQL